MARWDKTATRISLRVNTIGNTITIEGIIPAASFKGIVDEKPSEMKHWLPQVIEDQPSRTNITIITGRNTHLVLKPGMVLICVGRRLTIQRCIPLSFADTVIAQYLVCDI